MERLGEIDKAIILKLMFRDELSFSELWDKKIRSNKFNYHLKKLISQGYIEKIGTKYFLTSKAKELIAYFNLGDLEIQKQPLAIIGIVLISKGKILLQKLTKEPFKDCYALVCGKLEFGEGIEKAAKRIAFEKTGYIIREPKLKAIVSLKTFENKELKYHHHFYIVVPASFSGNLKDSLDRENKWIKIKELKRYYHFPDIDRELKLIKSSKLVFKEYNRQIKNKKILRHLLEKNL